METLEIFAGLSLAYLFFLLLRLIHNRHLGPLYPTPQQIEITEETPLLQANGKLTKEGWARRPLFIYDRSLIKANAFRIKEWDYYAIFSHDHKFCIAATVSDLGYAGLMSLSFIDLESPGKYQQDSIVALPLGSLHLAPSVNQDNIVEYNGTDLHLKFTKKGYARYLYLSAPHLHIKDQIGLECDLMLMQPDDLESMTIATSWIQKRKAFYLNTKVNCMATRGTVKIGNETIELNPEQNFATLDWGRGFWTYINTWYWSSASGTLNGESFGWNLGYGFTDRSPASENVIFYKGKVHKIGQIKFIMDSNDYMKPWKISGDKVNLTMTPIIDRSANMNFFIIRSDQHQVFGKFDGTVTLEDGTVLEINDFLAFAEEVYNRW